MKFWFINDGSFSILGATITLLIIIIAFSVRVGTTHFTARHHGAVMSNDAKLEKLCLEAGLQSGEHMVPMVWLPEALGSAMASPVADMVNDDESMGVYSSVGGYFIWSQVADIPGIRWAHLDLGDPVRDSPFGPNGRCTGFSVGLLTTCVRKVLDDVSSTAAAKL